MLRTDLSRDNSLVADARQGWWRSTNVATPSAASHAQRPQWQIGPGSSPAAAQAPPASNSLKWLATARDVVAVILLGGVLWAPLLLGAHYLGWSVTPYLGGLLEVVTAELAPLAVKPVSGLLKDISPYIQSTYLSSILTIAAYGFVALILFIWIRLGEGRRFRTIGFRAHRPFFCMALGVGVAILFTTLVVGGLSASGMIKSQATTGPVGMAALEGILVAALTYTVQASAEEMVYRGWLQNVIAIHWGPWAGVAITTIAFVAAHSRNEGFGLLPAVNLALFGLFLSLLALRTGSIWASCGWHIAWNWSINNVWGMRLSGLDPDGGSAMVWAPNGPVLFTGGAYGPEGGLLATAVLLGGTVWVALWPGLGRSSRASAQVPLSGEARLAAYRAAQRR
jgi:uncharacterized protein